MNLNTLKNNLEEKGYTVNCFETAADATEYLNTQINGLTVGFGGSMTLLQMKLYEKLSENREKIHSYRKRTYRRIPFS